MAKILVQKFTPTQTTNGKTKYKCIGTIDGDIDGFDMWDKPEIGVEFDGFVKDDPKYGKSVSTRSGATSGGKTFGGKPMEERLEIIRQSSVERANEYMRDKGNFLAKLFELSLIDDKPLLDHAANWSGTHLLNVALYITTYDLGRWESKATADEILTIMKGIPTARKETIDATPAVQTEAKKSFDVDPDEVNEWLESRDAKEA